ncbi:MAG: hypothetical protein WCP16_07365 [Pseudanabaena sp. ELA645]|jgi:hypothetical protein
MATTRTEKRSRKKRKPTQQFKLSYSFVILIAMLIVGTIAGVVAFGFGKQALEGVNSSPTGVKIPKILPTDKPKESPKSSPSSKPDNKVSFLLDESQAILDMKARSKQELGSTTRPSFMIKPSNDLKAIQTRVDRAYISMRDPLAISASADERIADRIAELRQRVYTNNRSYGNFSERPVDRYSDRPVASDTNNGSLLLSTPVELVPIRSSWQSRDVSLPSSQKVVGEDINVVSNPPSSFSSSTRPSPTSKVELNRQ